MQTQLAGMLFWINIEYLGIALLPAFWLIFIFEYTGNAHWISGRTLLALFALPVARLLLVWTNAHHHWHYATASVYRSGELSLLAIAPGVAYQLFTALFYIMLGWGVYLVMLYSTKTDKMYRRQNLLILLGALIPWIFNIVYLSGGRPLGHIDLTPIGFALTAVIITVALTRYKLFELTPVAREKAVDMMHEGLVILDHQHRILDLNPAFIQILNVARKELIGQNFFKYWPEPAIMQAIECGSTGRILLKKKTANGQKYFEVSFNSFALGLSGVQGMMLLFWDVTQQQMATEKLNSQTRKMEELNDMKDKLLSIISHDLRGPLASLKQLLDMIAQNMITEQEFYGLLPKLTRNFQYTTDLLDNLLYWSKNQMHGLKIEPERFDPAEIVRKNIDLLDMAAAGKKVIMRMELQTQACVYADRSMTDLVVRNVLSNAIKFSYRGGNIVCTTRAKNDMLQISIADTGIGIPAEKIDTLFSPDKPASPGTQNEKGVGLGLCLCKDFVEKNGGYIEVESEFGLGSTFTINLQLADQHAVLEREMADV